MSVRALERLGFGLAALHSLAAVAAAVYVYTAH